LVLVVLPTQTRLAGRSEKPGTDVRLARHAKGPKDMDGSTPQRRAAARAVAHRAENDSSIDSAASPSTPVAFRSEPGAVMRTSCLPEYDWFGFPPPKNTDWSTEYTDTGYGPDHREGSRDRIKAAFPRRQRPFWHRQARPIGGAGAGINRVTAGSGSGRRRRAIRRDRSIDAIRSFNHAPNRDTRERRVNKACA
jgi:hypothetical protein